MTEEITKDTPKVGDVITKYESRAHKICIFPTEEQKEVFEKIFAEARFVYNWAKWKAVEVLDKRLEEYQKKKPEATKPSASNLYMELSKIWTDKRPGDFKTNKNVAPSHTLRYEFRNIEAAYKRYLAGIIDWKNPPLTKRGRKKNYPRYRDWGAKSSFYVYNASIKVDAENLCFRFAKTPGTVKMATAPRFKDYKLMGGTITREADKWFLVLQYADIPVRHVVTGKTCGIDVGISKRAISAEPDGSNPHVLEFPEKTLLRLMRKKKHLQRVASRKMEMLKKLAALDVTDKQKPLMSKRLRETFIRAQKVQMRINAIRKDVTDKFTHMIANNYDRVVVEGLNGAAMHQGAARMRRMLQDSYMYEVKRQIQYKTLSPVVASTWYPSTKRCSACEHEQEMSLSDRVYVCKKCGHKLDRDLNAAINLAKYTEEEGKLLDATHNAQKEKEKGEKKKKEKENADTGTRTKQTGARRKASAPADKI